MIESTPEDFEIHCDECADATSINRDDAPEWSDMIDEIKAEGWRIISAGEHGWRHLCPACAQEEKQPAFGTPARLL